MTAAISISFSYVSLYTWFSSRERPATVERKLYDVLNDNTDRVEQLVSAGIAEGQTHALALEEMTVAEKDHGYISRAQDSDLHKRMGPTTGPAKRACRKRPSLPG